VPLVRLDPGLPQALPVGLVALPEVAVAQAADEADPLVAVGHQVGHRGPDAAGVVGLDGGAGQVLGLAEGHHHRLAGAVQPAQVLRGHRVAEGQEPVHPVPADR
jgi:hypothetical protein